MREDDDLIPWTEELPPRIDEGEYDAVVLSTKIVARFGLTTVEFLFRYHEAL
jgi:menaquinone-dependent protoporphyrinogen IX oxidase